ncbi:hypothetical protein ACG7TL_008612 [Trametes sanguinea]
MTLGLACIERPWDDTSGGSVSLATAVNSVPRTLPLDLCEAIIDRCAPPTWWESWSENQWSESVVRSARTLIACALTCHDWTARSRFNYYSFCVILRDAKDVDRFTDIIRRNPSIADFVRIFTVASSVWADDTSSWSNPGRSGQYVPFARTTLSRQLRNLHTVAYLRNLPWPFPTSCNLHIAQYRSLSTLYLCAQFRRPIDLCRLVWALEKLQRLHLYRVRFDSGRKDRLDPGYEQLRSLAARRPRCVFLQALVIDVSLAFIDWNISDSLTFPYECAFGTSATRFGMPLHASKFRTLLKKARKAEPVSYGEPRLNRYISSLDSLHDLILVINRSAITKAVEVDVQNIVTWLRDAIVPHARLCKSLARVYLQLWDFSAAGEGLVYALLHADNHLDEIFNEIPNLQQLIIQLTHDALPIELVENVTPRETSSPSFTDIYKAMPQLKAKLSVIVEGRVLDSDPQTSGAHRGACHDAGN